MRLHFGPRTQHISPRGIMGLVFGVGVLAIFWIGIPAFRTFMVLGISAGLVLGLARYAWRSRYGGATWRWRGAALDLSGEDSARPDQHHGGRLPRQRGEDH